MEEKIEDEKLTITLPDISQIKCAKCLWGYYHSKPLSSSCAEYDKKPNDVYYSSADCPKFKQIEEKQKDGDELK